jgi:methyl-accepting chemotaxis protein
LAAFTGLAPWGLQRVEKSDCKVQSLMAKCPLVEQLAANASSVGRTAPRMLVNQRAADADLEQLSGYEKSGLAAIEGFREMADPPASIRQGGGMDEALQAYLSSVDAFASQIRARRNSGAVRLSLQAGKGFAVAANEVRALAQQTPAATEDIQRCIGGMQSATASGVTEIEKISKVSEIVNSIAAAIEEQATAAKGIARNIAQASTADANSRVSKILARVPGDRQNITSVDKSAGEMAAGSGHVRGCATELSTVAEQPKLTLARFTV